MIICGTDFSDASASAVELASCLGRRLNRAVVLVHVVEPVPLALPDSPTAAVAFETRVREVAEASLARLADTLSRQGVRVETRVATGGAVDALLAVAREARPALIVLGTHGRKGPARLFLGSAAEQVVRDAPCPVLVSRSRVADASRWATGVPLRLVVGVDGTRAADAALAWTGSFGRTLPSHVTISRLYGPAEEAYRFGVEDDPWPDADGPQALRGLLERELTGHLRQHGLESEPGHRVRLRAVATDATTAFADEGRLLEVDALVVGTSRRRPLSGTKIATPSLLSATALPVFCVPEQVLPQPAELPRIRSVLVATDLSPTSAEAVRTAYGLMHTGGERVELCYVHARGRGAGSLEVPLSPALTEAERQAVAARLRGQVPPEAEALGVITRVSVIEAASAAEAVVQAAERLDVDLIVMGSHGRRGFRRAVLGSVAEEASRHATRPVLIVRARVAG